MGNYIKRFAFWNPGTWSIPSLYWDAFSEEQRIHAICKQLGKVIAYADYLGINVDDIAERLKAIEEGQLDQFIVDAIEQWFEDNQPAIVGALDSLNDALPISDFDENNTVKKYIDDEITQVTQGYQDADETLSTTLGDRIDDEITDRQNAIQDATWNYETGQNWRFIGGSFSSEELLWEITFPDQSISQSLVYHDGFFYIAHHVDDSSPMQISKVATTGAIINTIYLPSGLHGNCMDYSVALDRLVLSDTATTKCYCVDLDLTNYYSISNATSLSNVVFDRLHSEYMACRPAGGVQYIVGAFQQFNTDWYANPFWYLNGSVASNSTGQDAFCRDYKIYQLNYTNNEMHYSGIDVISSLGAEVLHMKFAADSALCNLQYAKGEVEGIDYYGPGDIPERGGQGEKYAIIVSHSDKRQSLWIIDSNSNVPIISSVYKIQARYATTFRSGVENKKVGHVTFYRTYLAPFFSGHDRRTGSIPIQARIGSVYCAALANETYTYIDVNSVNHKGTAVGSIRYLVSYPLIKMDEIHIRNLSTNTSYDATGLSSMTDAQFETAVTTVSTQIYNLFTNQGGDVNTGLVSAGDFPGFANGNASWKFTQ